MIIGCDPGLTGAITLIDQGRLLECSDLPVTDNGMPGGKVSRWVDVAALDALVRDWSARHDFARCGACSVIERPIPMPSMPSTTTASSFDTFGVIRAVLQIRVGEVAAVAPSEWKRWYGLKTDKNDARELALKLYPTAPVRRVKDHNRAESLLIAHWYWRTAR